MGKKIGKINRRDCAATESVIPSHPILTKGGGALPLLYTPVNVKEKN